MEKKRTVGTFLVAIFQIFLGVFWVCANLFFIYSIFGRSYHKYNLEVYVWAIHSFLILISGVYLLTIRKRARVYSIIILISIPLACLIEVFVFNHEPVAMQLLIFLSIISVYYLTRPKVKEQFK